MALRLLSRVRGTLPQGRSLPDAVWWGRHRAILIILWLHVPALAVAPGDDGEDVCGVFDREAEDAHLVERGAESHEPVA